MVEPGNWQRQTRVIDGELQVYRDNQGWIRLEWSAYSIGTVTWLMPTAPVEALNISREVGERVVSQLQGTGIALPVINIPGPPDRWALLMQPHDGPASDILDLFVGHDVGYAYVGRHAGAASEWGIDVPPTRHPGYAPLSWITFPDTTLPSARVVVDTLVDMLGT